MICFLKEMQNMKSIFVILFLCFFALLLGVFSSNHLAEHISQKGEQTHLTPKQQNWRLPISIPKGEFYKVAGWLADNQILYITNLDQTSNVYQYNLETGKSKLLYQSSYPIVTVQISPSRKFLLIQSSPSTYQGLVTITDLTGKEIMKQMFTAYELGFEWNPYNEEEMLVSKFNEDWTYQMHLLNIKNNTSRIVDLPQPFIKWMGKEEVAFLNYNEDKSELFAPIMLKEIAGAGGETTFSSFVYQFSAFYNLLMTITVNKKDTSKAIYTFYNKEEKQIYHFSIPQLSKFSDWLVPFYDYNDKKGQFMTLSPLESGDLGSYSKGFDLVIYNLKKGSSKIIIKGLKNEPLDFSPSGDACLFGNNFDKIINLKNKKMVNLVKG